VSAGPCEHPASAMIESVETRAVARQYFNVSLPFDPRTE
jgi:hypothetical protein